MPLDLIWSALARTRLQKIRHYTARDKPEAAERLAIRIVAAVEALRNFPHLGRAGSQPGTRELVIGKTPYIVVYRIEDDGILITTVWHGAQRYVP